MRRFAWRSAVVSATTGAALVIIFSASDALLAQSRRDTGVVYGDCLTTAQTFAVSAIPVTSRKNGEFTRLPEKISFVQRRSGCVLVAFTAENYISGSFSLDFRPLLDGDATAMPALVRLMSGSSVNAHGMNFVFLDVPAGRHVVQFEFASNNAATSVALQKRSTIINYVR